MLVRTTDVKIFDRDVERFERWVNRLGPHALWRGPLAGGRHHPDPYGIFNYTKGFPLVREKAHRVAWRIERGPIPEGILVLHDCDVKLCVDVEHLYLGDHGDNIQDAWDRGLRLRYRNYPNGRSGSLL